MAYTEQDYQEIKARLLAESQGVGDVPNAENLDGITSLPAYQLTEGQDIPQIVKAPLTLLAAPALEAADKANEAAANANEKARIAQEAAHNAYNSRTSVAYKRTNSTSVAAPTGGNFENPMPTESDWSKDIPEGLGKLWVSMRTFTSNGKNQDTVWSAPVAMTYNMYTEYKTSTLLDNPGNPNDNPKNWTDEFVEGYIWVATQLVYNGTKKGWVVVRAAGDTRQAVHNAEVATDAANVATASANQAAISANQSADNADAKAQAAQEAAANAGDTANHPTYIGTDHYAYKWNKTTKAYDKTDIYCKGNPGAPFRVAGEYDTLDALQVAVPNGSDIDGFMAVGTKVPYDYYAWVDGVWVNQGQIAGASGNTVHLPRTLLDLTVSSTSTEILGVFGGLSGFRSLTRKLASENCTIIIGTPELGAAFYAHNVVQYRLSYVSDTNIALELNLYTDGKELKRFHFYLEGDTARIGEASAFRIVMRNEVADNLTTDDATKVLSAKQGKALQDNKAEISSVLTKTNAAAYAPTQDYHPATKKYVDDNTGGRFAKVRKSVVAADKWYKIAEIGEFDVGILTIVALNRTAVFLVNADLQDIVKLFGGGEDIYATYDKIRFNGFASDTFIEIHTIAPETETRVSYQSLLGTSTTFETLVEQTQVGVDVWETVLPKNDIVTSDNITTITRKTASEYKAINPKDNKTMYAVTD